MDKRDTEIECRLRAIEYLIPHFMKVILLKAGFDGHEAKVFREYALKAFEEGTFGDTDPAQSDLYAAETNDYVHLLLNEIVREIEDVRPSKDPPSE